MQFQSVLLPGSNKDCIKIDWSKVDWKFYKFGYFIGMSKQKIHEQTGIPLKMIEDKAIEWDWKRGPKESDYVKEEPPTIEQSLLVRVQEKSSALLAPGEDSDALIDDIQLKLRASLAAKQEAFAPKYQELELNLLVKASQILAGLDAEDGSAHNKLRAVAQIYKDLLSMNGMLAQTAQQLTEDEGKSISVKILNNVQGQTEGRIAIEASSGD